MNTGTIVFLVLVAFLSIGKCQRHALISDLKRNANRIPSILPDTAGRPVNVSVGFTLNNIIDFNSKKQELELAGYLQVRWDLADVRLTWEPRDYDGIQDIRLNTEDLPQPDIKLYNGKMDVDSDTLMVLSHDGQVLYSPPVRIQSFCASREHDEEIRCLLRFGSWTYNCDKMPLTNLGPGIDLSEFYNSSKWILLNASAKVEKMHYSCCPEVYCNLDVNITLKDQSRS